MIASVDWLGRGSARPAATSDAATQTRHYLALDGLRGIAAIAVVAYHISLYFKLSYVPAHAYLAVDFFFMLSGFVISHAYDSRLSHGMRLSGFVIVRLVRLYPLIVLGVGIGTVALLVGVHAVPGMTIPAVLKAAIANLCLLPATSLLNVRALAFPTDSPLWSLTFEIWINIFYAVMFRRLTIPVLAACLLFGAALTSWASLRYGNLNIGFTMAQLYLGGARVLFPFIAGILLCRLGFGRGGPSIWGHAAALPLILALAGPDLATGVYDAAAVIILFPLVVTAGATATPWARLDRIWRFLGAVSYPLYVLHFPFVVVLSNVMHRLHISGMALYGAAAVTMLLILTVATAALYMYDQPLRRRLSQRLSPRAPA
jgi:peptidoglycan/LPS O-acetylase OafA/YrhL